jgi:hypothetical protein
MMRIAACMVAALVVYAPPQPGRAASQALAATHLEAAAAPGPAEDDPRVVELRTMHAEAQQRVERYNVTHDASHLVVARERLARWLVGHRDLYGDTPEAMAVRAPLEQQLGTIDAELVRVGPPPATAGAPAPTAHVSPPPAMTREHVERLRRAKGLVGGGVATLAVGGLVLTCVSLPLWVLRNRALDRANAQQFHVDERRLLSRAKRRHAGAITTFAVGSALAGAGVAMMTVGAVQRLRLRNELAIVPDLGPGFAGASASFRF